MVDGDGGGHTVDLVDRGFVHAVEKLARVGAEGFDVAPLAFGKQGVKHQARLARAAGAGDHRELAGANVEVEVFEVVLARPANADHARRSVGSRGWGGATDGLGHGLTMSTGILACVSTFWATLPKMSAWTPLRPCEPMTMRSQPSAWAVSRMPS